MGVMNCHRNGCENIMCDTYVEDVGYICFDCQEQFKEELKLKNILLIYESEIVKHLKSFMDTEKQHYKANKSISVNNFFKERTNESIR